MLLRVEQTFSNVWEEIPLSKKNLRKVNKENNKTKKMCVCVHIFKKVLINLNSKTHV